MVMLAPFPMSCVWLPKNLRETGETYSIYIGKTGLTEGRTSWKYLLGKPLGAWLTITINFNETDPTCRMGMNPQFFTRSGFMGTYTNGRDDSILHTKQRVAKYQL